MARPEVECWGKIARASKSDALKAIERQRRRHNRRASPVEPYKCGHCRCWHIGHQFRSPDPAKLEWKARPAGAA